jgi:hypothetical protein
MTTRALLLTLLTGCDALFGFDTPTLIPPADAGPDASPPVLTVEKAGSGDGEVKADKGSIDCKPGCGMATAALAPDTIVNLTATPAAGSFFAGWGGACSGLSHFCSVDVNGAITVTARFETQTENFIFATSQKMQGNFGGLPQADGICNGLAQSAGLSGHFVALLQEGSGTNVRDRLLLADGSGVPARGFMRLDGLPIVDTIDQLLSDPNQVWYPVQFDEKGDDLTKSGTFAFTGLNTDGTPGMNCQGWTSNTDGTTEGTWGDVGSGPRSVNAFTWHCSDMNALYCVQVDYNTTVSAPAPATGKLIWISQSFTLQSTGLAAADAQCDAEKPSSVANGQALLSTLGMAASSRLGASTLYVRPDGIPVGTGDEIIAGDLHTGIWVHADGTYDDNPFAWVGSDGIDKAATDATYDCNDWMDASATATGWAEAATISSPWWGNHNAFQCNNTFNRVYCIEE